MFQRSITLILVGLFSSLMGFFLCLFFKEALQVHWNGEVGFADLFNLFNTIVIAFLLQQYVQKRSGDNRVEKDHLIVIVKETIVLLQDCKNKFLECYEKGVIESPNDSTEIKSLLRNLSNGIDLIRESLSNCRFDKELQDFRSRVDSLYVDYKSSLTGGNFPSTPYDGAVFSDEEKTYQKLNTELLKTIFAINKK